MIAPTSARLRTVEEMASHVLWFVDKHTFTAEILRRLALGPSYQRHLLSSTGV